MNFYKMHRNASSLNNSFLLTRLSCHVNKTEKNEHVVLLMLNKSTKNNIFKI